MLENVQKPEKQVIGDGLELAVNSIFKTIQGEGPFAGTPSVFIRLAGCNLQCPLCDTEYTNRRRMLVPDIVNEAVNKFVLIKRWTKECPPLVVITGGEPFRQPIRALVHHLLVCGYRVQIETNGTLYQNLPFENKNLTIVCSPKAGNINKHLAPYIKAYKYVATVESLIDSLDGLPTRALEHPNGKGLARPPVDYKGDIYLQPVDEKNTVRNNRNMTAVVESCLKNGFRLCLQVHKIIGVD